MVEFDTAQTPTKDRRNAPIEGPSLGAFEFLRWGWRVLTSMRTAIVLLILLALAAIPGSLVPQRSSDPNGVSVFQESNPDLYKVYDSLQLFSTFTSVWFSAIYLLLFVSLIGCLIPRTVHHWRLLRAEPAPSPRTWTRLPVRVTETFPGKKADALAAAERTLRAARYRVVRDTNGLRAEFGYLRETGNLVFHIALMGILATLALAGGYGWNGQRVIVEGQSFTNQLASYESFHPGSWFNESELIPYGLTLDSFTSSYTRDEVKKVWTPVDYTATLTVTENGTRSEQTLKVNDPLVVGGSEIYLLGNGFAPVITVRDPHGKVVFDQPVVFLSQDSNLTSVGVVKVPDGLSKQLGMQGFFYPSAVELDSGALSSDNPEPTNPTVTLNLYTGDLGLDSGAAANVFQLPVDKLHQIAGRHTGVEVVLTPGDVFTIPGGLGTIEFSGLKRFVGLEMRHDPTQLGVGISVLFVVLGLIASLATRRRRVWVRVKTKGKTTECEWGAQSRGDDAGLEKAVLSLVERTHTAKPDRVSEA